MKFKLVFEDNTDFYGESLPKSTWNNAPNKSIEGFEYVMGKCKVVFKGFKEYNHLIENLGFVVKGTSKILLMARDVDKTFILTFNLINKKLYINVVSIGEEYEQQILSGWKTGILSSNPTVDIINLKTNLTKRLYPSK